MRHSHPLVSTLHRNRNRHKIPVPRCSRILGIENLHRLRQEYLQEQLLQQVLGDDDSLDLVRAFVDLGLLALTSTVSTDPPILRRYVHSVLVITGRSPQL